MNYIAAYLVAVSGIVSNLVTPFVIASARRLGLIDNPKTRSHPARMHTNPVPRGGGIPIFLGIFLPAVLLIPPTREFWGIFLGATVLLILGVWDDRKDRSPYIRFLFNVLAAAIVVVSGTQMMFVTSPLGGILRFDQIPWTVPGLEITIYPIASLLALIWIVWTMNIVGWSGGVDGQLPGFVSISAFVIGLLSLRFSSSDPKQLLPTYLAFLTAGSFLGFLPWNFFPQKIMPGYGGKTLGGFMLAVLAILASTKLGTAFLVLAVPMTDAVFMFLKRIGSGRSPVWASSGHLHHHLLRLGWSRRRIALFYWAISGIAGGIALLINSQLKVFAVVGILTLITGFILWVNLAKREWKTGHGNETV